MTVAAAYLVPVHDVHLRLGFRSGACHRCFPAFTSWHADARAGHLRPSIVGGIPIDPVHPDSPLSVGHEGTPRSSVSCAQRVAGLATQPA